MDKNNTVLRAFAIKGAAILLVVYFFMSFGFVGFFYFNKFHNPYDLMAVFIGIWIVMSFVGAGLFTLTVIKILWRMSNSPNHSG